MDTHTGLAGNGKDLNVQEHGAMLLAEMACSGGGGNGSGGGSGGEGGVAPGEVLDAVVTVANIARLQLQDKWVARGPGRGNGYQGGLG